MFGESGALMDLLSILEQIKFYLEYRNFLFRIFAHNGSERARKTPPINATTYSTTVNNS